LALVVIVKGDSKPEKQWVICLKCRAEEIRRISDELDGEIRNLKNRNENRIRVCMALNAVSFSADLLQLIWQNK